MARSMPRPVARASTSDGQPVQLLTVLVHKLKLVLGQWSVHGEKTNEPACSRITWRS